MSKMLNELLSEKQRVQITNIIKEQCYRFQCLEMQCASFFYEPYTQMRHKHAATSAVLSGFAPGKFQIEGITSTDLNYGLNKKMVQPELRCDNGIFHIYSNGSDLKGKMILERCADMIIDISSPPVFFILVVHIDKKGKLDKIEICLPNQEGTIVERGLIYECPKVKALTA